MSQTVPLRLYVNGDRYDIALAQLGITRASLSGAAGHA